MEKELEHETKATSASATTGMTPVVCERLPDAVALRHLGRGGELQTVSFSGLRALVLDFCRQLRGLLQPTGALAECPRVAVGVADGPLLPALCMAVLGVGAVFSPFSLSDPVSRLESMLLDLRPSLVLLPSPSTNGGSSPPSLSSSLQSILDRHEIPGSVFQVDISLPNSSSSSSSSSFSSSSSSSFSTILPSDSHSFLLRATPLSPDILETFQESLRDAWLPRGLQKQDELLERDSHVYFTSGSTGMPKGCRVSHRSLAAYCEGKAEAHEIGEGSVCMLASAGTFDPWLGDVCVGWSVGACLATADREAVFGQLRRCLQLTEATHVTTTPSMFATAGMPSDSPLLPALRCVTLGGEKMALQTARQWAPAVALHNVYGVTECMGYQTTQRVSPDDLDSRLCLGRSLNPRHCRVLLACPDPSRPGDQGRIFLDITTPSADLLPAQARGEVWISGAQLGSGYESQRLQQHTAFSFVTHPFFGLCYRTGDLARVQRDGISVQLIGRTDWQVKIRGVRTEMGDIEACLELPFVPALLSRVACCPLSAPDAQDARSSVQLHTFCCPAEASLLQSVPQPEDQQHCDGDPTIVLLAGPRLQELERFLRSEMQRLAVPSHMVPSKILFASGLPQTPTGKTNRKLLLEWARRLHQPSSRPPAVDAEGLTAMEMTVREAWSEELRVPVSAIGRGSHLAQLGGDSLAVVRIAHRLARALNSAERSQAAADDDEWGQLLGPLSPASLLKYPVLEALAKYLQKECSITNTTSQSPSQPTGQSAEDLQQAAQLQFLFSATANRLCSVVSYLLTTDVPSSSRVLHPLLKACVDQQLRTPLHLAAFNGATELVRIFLAAGGSPSWRDPAGSTVLHSAMHGGSLETVKALLQHQQAGKAVAAGHPVFSVDCDGQTVLHHAARFGAPLAVIELVHSTEQQLGQAALKVRRRPLIATADRWQRTPLHWASLNGFASVVAALLELPGVDASAKDQQGETALDMAERRARCGASDRAGAGPPSKWSGVAKILGGSGTTEAVKSRLKREAQTNKSR